MARKSLIDMGVLDAEIEAALEERSNMFGRAQLWRRDSQCGCGQAEDFARGEEVAKSLRNGRLVRRAVVDIEDIRWRAESDTRSRGN